MKFLYMFMQTFAIIRPTHVRVPYKCKLAKKVILLIIRTRLLDYDLN